MGDYVWKMLVTAAVVVAIGELARRSTLAGALLASLPLTSLLALVWLYRDTGSAQQAAQLAGGIFWLVLPSLLFFLVFPLGVRAGWSFWTAMSAGCAATVAGYGALTGLDRLFEWKLFA